MSLLAALDPYTMGFGRRARLLDPDRQDFVYDRGGNATSLALVLIPRRRRAVLPRAYSPQ